MKYNCEIIQDLLPLYFDKASSEETNNVINEHFQECENCKSRYAEMNQPTSNSDEPILKDTLKIVSYKKRIRRRRLLIITSVALTLIILFSSIVSYKQFYVTNPFASSIGLLQILSTDQTYIEIQKNPRVVLAKPDDPWNLFLSVMMQDGYTYLEDEGMSNIHVFEKDGNKISVRFTVNGYYSQWTWL